MILYVAKKKKENQLTGEASYFLEEKEFYSFLNSQKQYGGYAVEPFINTGKWIPINWSPEKMMQDDSTDYIKEYRQFKNNLETQYQEISVSIFLEMYPRMLAQKEIMKLLKISKKGLRK